MGINKEKRYKNIVWDWNGTLLDDVAVNVETLNSVMQSCNLEPIGVDFYKEQFIFPVRAFYDKLGFDWEKHDWEKISVDFIETYMALSANGLSLAKNVKQVLTELKARGFRLFVLSALKENVLKEMLETYELTDLFTGIYGAYDIYAAGKVERGRELVANEGINVSRTVMIGDTLHDAEVAHALGFDAILYSGGHNSRARLEKIAPVIDNMEELLELRKAEKRTTEAQLA
ncbi:MAG: HAD family hydrolase [Marinifilaceae bacterium]